MGQRVGLGLTTSNTSAQLALNAAARFPDRHLAPTAARHDGSKNQHRRGSRGQPLERIFRRSIRRWHLVRHAGRF